MTRAHVRRAVAADAADIAHVHVQAWHEAYTGRIPQEILDRMDVERFTLARERHLRGDVPDDRSETWVAECDGELVGFAMSGPCRDEDAAIEHDELYAIYVLASHYGSGAGGALLDAAIGDRVASLWVLADNPRAHAFYAKHGFAPDGAVKDDDRWGEPIHEVRLVRRA